jgi:predicted adenine nucleotide alpha hydrolase (AANH) superfamily ATPase
MKGKRVLVHICCAPCFVAPWHHLQEEGFAVHGFWFNHNIHPYTEYRKRLETLQEFAQQQNVPLIVKDEYPLEMFLRNAAFRESDRCRSCYYERLKYAAIIAAKGKFDYFTTTLLYSKFQNHAMIRQVGEALGKQYGVSFLYRDFREYWKEGIARSKELEMYRQQYCGCIYSERDRYVGKKM